MLREEELRRLAAAHVLWKGCASFRLADVVAACGVSRGTSYLHFPSRSSLIAAALAHMDGALAARLAAPPTAGRPRAGLRRAILQAVEAQTRTLSLWDARALPDGGAVDGQVWPCCLRAYPCPYRGAARSLERIADWARATRPAQRGPLLAEQLAPLIVHLAPRLLTNEKSRGGGSLQPSRIKVVVDYLIDRLIPS